jgi:hypothetical protein
VVTILNSATYWILSRNGQGGKRYFFRISMRHNLCGNRELQQLRDIRPQIPLVSNLDICGILPLSEEIAWVGVSVLLRKEISLTFEIITHEKLGTLKGGTFIHY